MRVEAIYCDLCKRDITKENRGAISFNGHGASKLFPDICLGCFEQALQVISKPDICLQVIENGKREANQ